MNVTQQNATKTVHILVVEDNPGDVQLIREGFQRLGHAHTLSHVSDGQEALAFLQKRDNFADALTPDLVVLDLSLPGRHGLEVLAELKRDPRLHRIPVVVFSNSSAQADVDKSYELHASSYVTKARNVREFFSSFSALDKYWCEVARLPSHPE